MVKAQKEFLKAKRWSRAIFKVFKEVPEHQRINHLVRKYSASEIRGDFENQMLNWSPKVSTMIIEEIQLQKTSAFTFFMTQQIPEVDEVQMSNFDIEDSSNASN
jgi:hypothetical protein